MEALFIHLKDSALRNCDIRKLLGQDDKMSIEMKAKGDDAVSLMDFIFTKKMILYVGAALSI